MLNFAIRVLRVFSQILISAWFLVYNERNITLDCYNFWAEMLLDTVIASLYLRWWPVHMERRI